MDTEHKPVLFAEVIEHLMIKPDGIYVDGTFGRGGHSRGILSRLNAEGRLYALDKDPEAIAHAKEIDDKRFVIAQASFAQLPAFASEWQIAGKIDGILLDLGVSSPQLDKAERGFSFMKEGPLDMRMDPERGLSAKKWLSTAKEADIANVLRTYGEEKHAHKIAKAIVAARITQPLETTTQLADIIKAANPFHEFHKHPATRSFQGIRIFINQELHDLELFLENVLNLLAPGGRLCIISFHSLEDRIVKRFFRQAAKGDNYPKHLPIQAKLCQPKIKLIGKDIRPSAQECKHNIRARSGIMRVAEKIA